MREYTQCGVAALAMAVLLLASSAVGAPKGTRLVAVFDFDYATVPNSWGDAPLNIGAGLADMLVTELATEGTYTVVERKQLEKVLNEQRLNSTNAFDQSTATEVGRLLGVDAIVIGSVTKFGTEKSTTNLSGQTQSLYGGTEGVKIHAQKAEVAIDVRVLDTKSGAILLAARGVGEDRRKGFAEESPRSYAYEPGASQAFSDISQQLVGGAAAKAVAALTEQLALNADKVRSRPIRGTVAAVDGDLVVMNVGRAQGARTGDVVAVERVYKKVMDPADPTKVLRNLTRRVALCEITEVDEVSAVGRLLYQDSTEALEAGLDAVVTDSVLTMTK